MKKYLLLSCFIIIISSLKLNAQEVKDHRNNVDTLQYNYNLVKSDNIQWIENNLMYLHIIGPKQTLYSISKLYNISIDDIISNNKLDSADDIKAGQLLLIPALDVDKNKYPKKIKDPDTKIEKTEPEETDLIPSQDTINYLYVYINPKETLYHLSHVYNVSVEEIKEANDGLAEGLKAHTTIKIPKIKKEEISIPTNEKVSVSIPEQPYDSVFIVDTVAVMFIEHKVKARETLYKISKEYSVTPEDIIKYNPRAAKKIKRNQILLIPIYQLEKEEIITEPDSTFKEIIKDEGPIDLEKLHVIKSKRKFKVALLLPLYLEEDKNLNVNDLNGQIISGSRKPFRFVQFYQGAKLALDSLAVLGLNVDLHVYDIDETYSKAQKLVNSNVLKDFDLVIGPLYRQVYNVICSHVSEYGIPIVIPTIEMRDNSCNYNNIFKLSVDNTTKLKYIANYILANYPNANIIFYSPKSPTKAQQEEMQYLQDLLNRAIPERIKFSNVDLYNLIVDESAADSLSEGFLFKNIQTESILLDKDQLIKNPTDYTYIENKVKVFDYSVSGVAGYRNYLSLARQNVVISFTDDNSAIVDNLSRLNSMSSRYRIHLFGNENWLASELDYQSLRNVDFHLCTSRLIDYNNDRVKEFIEIFTNEYIAEPARYAFLGFDTFYFFCKLLFLFDNDFTKYVSAVKYNGLEYSLFFNRTKEYQGYENFSAGIYEVFDYQLRLQPSDDYIWDVISVDLEDIK